MNWALRLLGLAALAAAVLLGVGCASPSAPSAPATLPQTPAGSEESPALIPTQVAEAPSASASPPTAPAGVGSACDLAPVVVPTPAADPGYTRLDPTTGLHVTGKMQLLDPSTYRLRVTGAVEAPLELTYDEIRCLPRVEDSPTLTCPGFFVDDATWAGTPIADVLALAGVQPGAKSVQFVAADGYTSSLPLEKALDRANFLAYEWDGEPLPRLHGFPLRVVIPGAFGSLWTKWLIEINVR